MELKFSVAPNLAPQNYGCANRPESATLYQIFPVVAEFGWTVVTGSNVSLT